MRLVVGQLRKSQAISTFGIGSMIDLPAISAVVMGLDYWMREACPSIGEPRLLRVVQQVLGPHVREIREAPDRSEAEGGMYPTDPRGLPVTLFPRWLRCPLCSALAPVEQFELRTEPFRVDRLRYIHANCPKRCGRSDSRMPGAVPARFVIACNHGHLDDFPWIDYVHRGTPCSCPALRLFERGVTGEAADVYVRCDACGATRTMVDAFNPAGSPRHEPFTCTGNHPHLRIEERCEAKATPLLIGASNSYFPLILSVLSLPSEGKPLLEKVRSAWSVFGAVQHLTDICFLRRLGELRGLGLEAHDDGDIFRAVQELRETAGQTTDTFDLKRPEWDLFSSGRPLSTSDLMHLQPVEPPPGFERWIERAVLVEKHVEVRALVGFTRLEFTGDIFDFDLLPRDRWGPLARNSPRWVPGVRMRGEGIFLQFREDAVAAWERKAEVRERERQLEAAHENWCNERPWMISRPPFPGARYAMIHSLSHALMRELGIRCGYGTASIRERIYCAAPSDPMGPMAGVLLATASPDSEGTLGGLVGHGEPRSLASLLRTALDRLTVCASDPMCALYEPKHRSNRHGAACHTCAFVPETSCERSNHFLDRALLVETAARLGAGFFERC